MDNQDKTVNVAKEKSNGYLRPKPVKLEMAPAKITIKESGKENGN